MVAARFDGDLGTNVGWAMHMGVMSLLYKHICKLYCLFLVKSDLTFGEGDFNLFPRMNRLETKYSTQSRHD